MTTYEFENKECQTCMNLCICVNAQICVYACAWVNDMIEKNVVTHLL